MEGDIWSLCSSSSNVADSLTNKGTSEDGSDNLELMKSNKHNCSSGTKQNPTHKPQVQNPAAND